MIFDKKNAFLIVFLFCINLKVSSNPSVPGISIVVPTIRQHHMEMVFDNYAKQTYPKKELIVVLNDNSMNLNLWRERAQEYENVRVYKIAQENNKNQSMNFGFDRAKYDYFAIMDDDDFYSKRYLERQMKVFETVETDVVGKGKYFFYYEETKNLSLLSSGGENGYITMVIGGTIILKRNVFEKMRFRPEVKSGVDVVFCKDCWANGFKVYASDRYDFCNIRGKDQDDHLSSKKIRYKYDLIKENIDTSDIGKYTDWKG